jgi:transglutaminase-like putative cysteine protease
MRLPACACWKTVVFILFAFIPVSIFAQHVSIRSAPAWVTPHRPDVGAKPNAKDAAGSYYLLIDKQSHVEKQTDFFHYAYKLITSEGVQEMSDISVAFDPSFQKLTFHQCIVHRDGKTIGKLSAGNIRTIQREESMDRYLYDGSLSAVINLQDVRAGDIIEYAYSIEGYNPVYEGHYTNIVYFDFTVPYEQFKERIIFPAGKKIYVKYFNDEVKPEVRTVGTSTEYQWSLHRVNAAVSESNEPSWYEGYRFAQVTDFKDWTEVAAWATKQFEVTEREQKQLQSKTDELFKGLDKPALILKAIRFVQDEVRYLGFESGLNSHKPHAPLNVFEQRFGDCKDKSLLLTTILNIYGVEAYPMLVSTTLRDYTSERLPSHTIFNHCVTQIVYEGKTIFIDPTISNQGGSLQNYYFPTYGQGLVVNKDSKALLTLPGPGIASISEEQTFDISQLGGEAIFSVRTVYKGVEADIQRSDFASRSINQIQKDYIAFYTNLYADIMVMDTVHMEDNREENIITIHEKYKVPGLWTTKEGESEKLKAEFYPLTLETHFSISKSQSRNAPYKLSFPLSYEHNIRINLPESWNITPDNRSIETSYYNYDYRVSYDAKEQAVILQTKYNTKSDHIPVSAMAAFIDDHVIMMKNLSYNLFYNKNAGASGANWVVVFISLFALYLSVRIALRLYQYYDPEPELTNTKDEPIGGWLILLAIGLIITPLRITYTLMSVTDFYNHKTWLAFWDKGQYGLIFNMCVGQVHKIISVTFSLLLILLFFERRSSFPKLIVIFFGLNVAVAVVDCFIELMHLGSRKEQQVNAFVGLLGSLVIGCIWMLYINASTRVRATFVKRSDSHNKSREINVPVDADSQQV